MDYTNFQMDYTNICRNRYLYEKHPTRTYNPQKSQFRSIYTEGTII